MNVWIVFFRGLIIGMPFGALFNIPKYGRTIVLIGACLAGVWVLTDPSILNEMIRPWYIGASEFLGIIIGQLMGAYALDRALDEWGISH